MPNTPQQIIPMAIIQLATRSPLATLKAATSAGASPRTGLAHVRSFVGTRNKCEIQHLDNGGGCQEAPGRWRGFWKKGKEDGCDNASGNSNRHRCQQLVRSALHDGIPRGVQRRSEQDDDECRQ
jgi:hypothetical protein